VNNQWGVFRNKVTSKISDVRFDDKVVTKGDNPTFEVILNYSLKRNIVKVFYLTLHFELHQVGNAGSSMPSCN